MLSSDNLAVLISLCALGIGWLAWRSAKEANQIATESKDIAKRTFDFDHVPQLSIELNWYADSPTAFLIVDIKNQGKIPVTIIGAGLKIKDSTGYLVPPEQFYPPELRFPMDWGAAYTEGPSTFIKTYRTPEYPIQLAVRESVTLIVSLAVCDAMLQEMNAKSTDEIYVVVADKLGDMYLSAPKKADWFREGQILLDIAGWPETPELTRHPVPQEESDGWTPALRNPRLRGAVTSQNRLKRTITS